MAKQAFDAARGVLFYIDPAALDLIEDEKHPLYDPRVKLPVSESLICDIMVRGVIEPVVVRKSAEGAPEVVDGRQRTKAAREAAARLKAAGRPELRVPCVLRKGDEADLLGVLISANEHRQDDAVLDRAAKANRLINLGQTEAEVAVAFGVSAATIKNWIRLLEAPADVRKALKNGVSATLAIKLLDLSDVERKKVLTDVVSAAIDNGNGESKRQRQHKAARAAEAAGAKAPRMRTRREIEERVEVKNLPKDYRKALEWVLRVDE